MAFRNLPEMPCGPILELHGQRKRFHVPYGLKRLIEEMTREVLRFQPENIYDFLAGFMDSRLQRKLAEEAKNQTRKSWQQHRWSWERGSVLEPDELKEFLETLPAPVEEVNHHAVVIQAAFRGYQARKKVKEIRKSLENEEKRASEADGKRTSGEKGDSSGDKGSDKRSSQEKRNTIEEITPETATDEELRSAVIIQAAFRGMHARNEVKKLRQSATGDQNAEENQNEAGKAQPDEATPVENAEQAAAETVEDTAIPTEDAEAVNTETPAPNDEATVPSQTNEETPIEPHVEESEDVVNPPTEEEHHEAEEEEVPNPEETKTE